MEHAYCAGAVVAETASQLVLGAVFCTTYFIAKRQVEWLAFGIGCVGLGTASWAMSAIAMSDGSPSRPVAMAFSLGTTLAVSLVAFGLAWLTRGSALRRLAWFAAATGVAWQLVLGYAQPFATYSKPWAAAHARVGNLLHGCLAVFLFYLAAIVVVAALLLLRTPRMPSTERQTILFGLFCLAVGFAVDGASARWFPRFPSVFSHAAFACSLLLGATLALQHKAAAATVRAMELRLTESLEQLATAQATVARVQGELGAKKQLAAVGELAAAIAHEVRNPLAIIMNAAAGLRRPTIGTEDRATLLSILDEETARLNRLVTDLLRFARPVIIKRSSVSLLELARRAEGRLEDKHRLLVSIPDQPELKSVEADANLLRLVFDNLVSNAFQAMPEGGAVEIVVTEEQGGQVRYVRIDITDQGHGMEEQVLARATDPFYTTRPSGTGLGLPIVQRILEAHGGQMKIDSSPGQGTKVSLFLPLLAPSAEAEPTPTGVRA